MTTITLEVPDELAKRLQRFENPILIELLKKLVDVLELLATPLQTKAISTDKPATWQENLQALRQQIQADGGLKISQDPDEMVEQLRQTRYEIFEAEYAHLY